MSTMSITVPISKLRESSFSLPNNPSDELYKYLTLRMDYLEKLVQEANGNLGPALKLQFMDLIITLPFIADEKYIWPLISLNYKGGVVLTWASSTSTFSMELADEENVKLAVNGEYPSSNSRMKFAVENKDTSNKTNLIDYTFATIEKISLRVKTKNLAWRETYLNQVAF